jgi:hypothetical protein
MEVKTIEIRDSGTFIPAVAVRLSDVGAVNSPDHYLLRRAGFALDGGDVFLCHLTANRGTSDPYDWRGRRTMQCAHLTLCDRWDEFPSGSVLDVQFIIGETAAPKESERVVYGPIDAPESAAATKGGA